MDARPETIEKGYQLCNSVNPDTDGVSQADFFKLIGLSMKKYAELKAAAGQ